MSRTSQLMAKICTLSGQLFAEFSPPERQIIESIFLSIRIKSNWIIIIITSSRKSWFDRWFFKFLKCFKFWSEQGRSGLEFQRAIQLIQISASKLRHCWQQIGFETIVPLWVDEFCSKTNILFIDSYHALRLICFREPYGLQHCSHSISTQCSGFMMNRVTEGAIKLTDDNLINSFMSRSNITARTTTDNCSS